MSHPELAASLSALSTPVLVVIGVLGLAELGLDVFALVDLYRRPAARVALGNKWIWVLIILLVNLVGAILYLAVGRLPTPSTDASTQASRPPGEVGKIVDSLYGTPARPDDPK